MFQKFHGKFVADRKYQINHCVGSMAKVGDYNAGGRGYLFS